MYKKLLLSLLLFSMTLAMSAQRRSLNIASVNEMAGSVSVGNLSSSISASSTTAGLYNVTNGTTVQIVATANAGYNFVCWREGVSIYSRTADTTVTVRSNRSLTAVFVSVCDTMTLAVNDTTMGSIEMLYEFTPLDTVDLSTIQSDYTVQDGTVLTGTLGGNRRISVADGASIMLSNMAILGVHMSDNGSHWAGLTLLGDATIVLDGGTANYIRGFNRQDPGILVPVGATLTICGSGELTAESGNSHSTINDSLRAAGIGGGYNLSCGNIVINGGTITTIGAIGASLGSGYNADCGNIAIHGGIVNASSIGCGNGAYIDSIIITGGTVNAVGKNLQSGIGTDAGGTVSHILITGGTVNAKGGASGAGIGCGQGGTCYDITITGGTVVAEGGIYAAGIGSGQYGHSYNITIASTVASVTAKKGMGGNDVKNIGNGDNGSGGTITVGGQPYTDPNSDVSTYTGTGDNSVQEEIAMSISLTDGRYSAPRGRQVVAKATAKQGYHLDAWSDGAAVNAAGTDTITVNGATALTAFFAQDPYSINVAVLDTNSGNAVVIYNDSAATSHLVEPNTNNVITISATAKYGYHFDRWEEVDTMYNFTFYSRTADTTVSATGDRWFYAFFEPNLYTISTNTADTNMGTAAVDNNMQGPAATSQPSVEAEYNSWVMLTATPKPGYRFVCWREADSVYSHTADTFVVVTADRSFTAEFDISAVDLAITNVNLDVATSNVPQFTINVTNNGTEDLTGECCIRIYKDYLGGDTVADCAMSARSIAAGETRSLSYYFFTSDLCSLGEGDSLVFEVRTDSTQPDTIATNNVAGLNIGTIFPWRNTYEYVSDTVCDSLRWNLNNHLYRESGTYEYSAVTNYNGGQCDSIVVLDLTVNHGYSIDTFAIELDSYNWRGNEFRIVQTATFTSQVTMPTAAGCDSTVTLHLMLIPTDTVTLLINDTTMGSIELAADTIHLDTLTADFTAQDGAVLTGRYDGAQHRIYIADGATVTLAGIDIPGRDYMQVHEVWNGITCLGDATLLLADGTMNKVNAYEFGAGIFVPQGNTLAIYGSTGWLNATSPSGAGIGGGTESTNIHTTAGNIVIYGGNIIARCSEGSGIGSYTGTCGDITIHGGNIYATSLHSGAGIGTGAYGYCGNILITGGTVSATSGGYGAAIGTGLGDPYAQKGVCGDITIMGGNITALTQTYRDLAAIGAGTEGFCGNILIAGGTVDATGPVAIGANVGHCGDIVVANTVTRMVSHTTYNYAFGDSYGAHVTIGNSEGWAYSFTADTDFYGSQPLLHPAPVSINYPSLISPIGDGRYRVAQNQNVVAKASPNSCHHSVSWSTADSVLTTDSAFLIPHSVLNQYTNTPLLATLQRDLYTSDTTVHAVNHYTWNGTEYTTGGDIQDSLYTAEGCDSLATLHLTLDYIDTVTLAVNDTNMGSIEMLYAFTPLDTVDLSTIHSNYTVQDGTVLTGTLGGNHKISIAAGASVMLKGVSINRIEQNNNNPRPGQGGNQSTPTYLWAGLSLLGDATIVLDDSNYVKGFNSKYPGIHVPAGSTLTIRGEGILTASPGEKTSSPYFEASAIGGGYLISNGNIVIESGTIHAHGNYAAGIGGGYGAINPRRTCGNITIRGGIIDASSIGCGDSETIDSITISGGTVIATGNDFEAGVGSGNFGTVNHIVITGGTVIANGGYRASGIGGGGSGHCGEVVIDSTVTLVTSTGGRDCPNHIGAGTWSTVDTVIVAGQGYTNLDTPFSYTGSGTSDNFTQPLVFAIDSNSYIVQRGKRVVVQATPKPNHYLAEWSDSAAVNTDNTDTLTVNGSMLLTAIFAHDPYYIGVAVMDTSMGSAMVVYNDSVASRLLVEPDSVCTITATPKFGYHFVCWEEADSLYSSSADTSVTAFADRFFYALFARTYDTITLAVNDTSMGRISLVGVFTPIDTVNLDTIQGDYTVQDGTVLTGTLGGNYKISVAAGASVMLSNMNITGVHDSSYMWAGLSLLGDATIVLDDSTTNYIKGYFFKYPGIHVPVGATLTLRGNGQLTAESGKNGNLRYAAGIGGGYDVPSGSIVIENGIITTLGGYGASLGGGYNTQRRACGNIAIHGGTISATCIGGGYNALIDSVLITGGTITARASTNQPGIGCDGSGILNHLIITGGTINATGGSNGAGIGCGRTTTVNHITITGGTITAKGGNLAAGIGSGSYNGHCGEIVIASSVTSVTAIKGNGSTQNIGSGESGTCDTVIVGGQPYTDNPNASSYTFVGDGSTPSSNIPQPSVIAIGDNIYRIARGTTVVVQATAKPGHHLAEWSDGTEVNAENTDTLMVNGSMWLMAIFEQNPYLISAASADTAMGSAVVIYNDSVASTLPVEPGATFFLEATANPCHHFVCWTKGADTVASESIIELQATDTSFYIAHFERNLPLLGDTIAEVCDSLVWFGTAYTATDTATHTLLTAEGCDSTVTLHLTVKYSSTGDTSAVVCDLFLWYDSIYTATSAPTHRFTNAVGCDSTVTLNLTVNYKNTGDTVAVVCDSFAWYGDTYTASNDSLTHFMEAANQWGCDSTVILHLTVNYQNTGDTTAVECDRFSWYEHDNLTASVDSLTHLFANRWGCDSTVTLHLTVNYQNTGDTTAVECDQFTWYEHTRVTASTDTLTHLFVGGNQWGCDSTVTLHLTVNYQNTGDTTAVECDQFSWYEHQSLTASDSTLTHLFLGGNQWGCDSTVTLHLTINYQNTGDTTAVECDQYSWYEHQNLTASDSSRTHLFPAANQWGCDSTVTLHLTVNYQNTGDTTAVECNQFSWYEHQSLTASSDTLTHLFEGANQWGCDSTVTLHLTVKYSSTSDTTAVECDQFAWCGTTYTASGNPERHYTNAVGCDSTRTLHLTVNYQNTGDTTAVECDQFSWYEHDSLTASSNTLTHLFQGSNVWGCDSTVTLHLTVNYKNTGDTTIVACDQYNWYEHTGLTTSVDTLTHLFVGGNQWGCDSTVTLHLTVNYQNTGDTTAVKCDQFNWYEHQNLTTSSNNLTHLFAGANQWGCDSTVTLHLTVNYQNTGDTTAVECDQFSWYEHQNLTTSSNNRTHRFVGANQWGCDSVVTLHLTVNYQNTGDTSAVTYQPFTWYEHTNMESTQNVQHTFAGSNRWGCDSTVTLHLRYALFSTNWSGPTTVTYNSEPQTGLTATYVDDTGHTQQVSLTFTKGNETITTPNYPVTAGEWTVTARPMLEVDSLSGSTVTLNILPATVYVSGATARIAKVGDGTTTAEVTDPGTLNNIQGSDPLSHTTTANFDSPSVGENKTITLTYTLQGAADLVSNYVLQRTTEVYSNTGAIVDPIQPNEQHTFDIAQYGYCTGSGTIDFHLSSGTPDQYKIDYDDNRFADVEWTELATTGLDGTIPILIPDGLPTGDYSLTLNLRDSRYPWIESIPITTSIHVNLPSSYTMPLFYNVIILIDTCECFTDIQWYHRETGGEWEAIPGANDYHYRQVDGLTGEYFVSVRMSQPDGASSILTYTCPQTDVVTLVRDPESKDVSLKAYPNPANDNVTITLTNTSDQTATHILRVVNTIGVEMEQRTFDGNATTLDISAWQRGNYIVSVDGIIVRFIKD